MPGSQYKLHQSPDEVINQMGREAFKLYHLSRPDSVMNQDWAFQSFALLK